MGQGRFVLDTHAFIWSLTSPERLGARAAKLLKRIDAGDGQALVPAAALAELCLLREAGRTPIGLAEARAAFDRSPNLWLLPLDVDQVETFAALGGVRDIFDRFIVAAAKSLGARLITRDGGIAESGLVATVWD